VFIETRNLAIYINYSLYADARNVKPPYFPHVSTKAVANDNAIQINGTRRPRGPFDASVILLAVVIDIHGVLDKVYIVIWPKSDFFSDYTFSNYKT
jgi:hypothetical protein